MNSIFLVKKEQLNQTKIINEDTPQIFEEEVLFKIDKYFLSSNNITYAANGDNLKYWNFFPQEGTYGVIPVWASLAVVKSNNTNIKEGERFFGFAPMGNYFKVRIGNYSSRGFSDISEHRTKLIALYNFYTKLSPKDFETNEILDYSIITRITFPTSFLLKSLLEWNSFFKAEQVIITSASSKTALGLAFLLNKYKNKFGKKIIGITSSRSKKFVENSKFYDQVITYSDVNELLPKCNSVIIDFSGNSDLLIKLNEMLQDYLKYISLVGATNWEANKPIAKIPHCVLFDSGNTHRRLIEEYGMEKAMHLISTEMTEFTKFIKQMVSLSHIDEADLPIFYQKLLNGQVSPEFGYFIQNK